MRTDMIITLLNYFLAGNGKPPHFYVRERGRFGPSGSVSTLSSLKMWWMTDVTKLMASTLTESSLNQWTTNILAKGVNYKLRTKTINVWSNKPSVWTKTLVTDKKEKMRHFETAKGWRSSLLPVSFAFLPLLSLPHSLPPFLSLVIEWIISCQGPWNHTPNPELPFLLASKIFIRTIRSSDKASTESLGVGWGMQRGQDMPAGRLFCNTLYLDHRPVLINLRHSSVPLCPQPDQAARRRWHSASHTPHPATPLQQALLCPRSWAGGVGHTTCTEGGGGHKGNLIVELTHRSHHVQKQGLISTVQPTRSRSEENKEGGMEACGLNGLQHDCYNYSFVNVSNLNRLVHCLTSLII